MSADKDWLHDDGQQIPLLDKEEVATDARAHSASIKEDAEEMLCSAAGPEQEIEDMARDQDQQNDGSENSMMANDNGMDRGKKQMMSVLLISIMLVLVSVTFSQTLSPFMIKNYESSSQTSQDILIVYMLVGFPIIGAMFLHKDAITEAPDEDNGHDGYNGNVTGGRIKYILRDYLSIVGMTFFFPFACILDLSKIIAAAGCDEVWRLCGDECYGEYVVDFFYHLIRILFMGAELAFCCKFHKSRFKESGPVRCGLMIVMAGNLGLWFLSLVCEATEQDSHRKGEGNKCSSESCHLHSHKMPENWEACVNQTSSAHKVMDVMIHYLYPFAIEFSLLVGEILLTKFISSTSLEAGDLREPSTTGSHEDSANQLETRESDLAVPQRPQTPRDDSISARQVSTSGFLGFDQSNPAVASGHRRYRLLGQLLSVLVIAIALCLSFAYICLGFVGSSAQGLNETDTDRLHWEYVYETYSMINYMLLNVLLVVGYVCGFGFDILKMKLHGLDWLVLISAFGPFMNKLIVITMIATCYKLFSPADFPAILIWNRLANLIQLILQAPFVFLSERWRLTERQRSQPRYLCQEKILKAVILGLAVTNLTNWISNSIVLPRSLSRRDELTKAIFVPDNFRLMNGITIPLLIFYRFNSFLLFTRTYLGD